MNKPKPYMHDEALERSRHHKWTMMFALSGAALLIAGMWIGWSIRTNDCDREWDIHEEKFHE